MARTGRDLTGQKFGKLTVLGFGGYEQNKRQRVAMWNCHCDCGSDCQVEGYLLVSGRRKSCGCIRRAADQMEGERFGKLVVLGADPDNQTTLQKVLCRCDCGNVRSVATRELKNGKITSCGCDGTIRRSTEDFMERQYDAGMEALRVEFRQGKYTQIHTLKEWVYVWIREMLQGVVKPTTIRMYAETMKHHIFPALGEEQLQGLSGEKLEAWLALLSRQSVTGTRTGKMTEGTVRNVLSVLSGSLRDAQKYGLIDSNPCLDVHFFEKKDQSSDCRSWLQPEQIRQLEPVLVSYKDEDGYPLGLGFQLVLYTGITLSEAAALRWKDVDFQEKILNIRYFVAMKRTRPEDERVYDLEKLTGRKNRKVPVPDFMVQMLKSIKERYQGNPEDFVLGNQAQEPVRVDRMRAALQRRSHMCGMDTVTPRMLRDTYAMRAVQAGATSDLIAELMGFASSQQVIRRYMPANKMNERELLDRMFGNRTS